MIRVAAFIAAAMLLAGCEGEAERAVALTLRDPDSAKFRDVGPCLDDPSITKGEVNGKNGFGAYAGYRHFFVIEGRAVFSDSAEFDELLVRCYGPVANPAM